MIKEKELVKILKDFREKTNILSSIIFSEDGFVIAIEHTKTNGDRDEDYLNSISAICAGIVVLADNGLKTIKNENSIKTITIQAGDNSNKEGFIILLQSLAENIILSVVFPSSLNFGLINFELKETIKKLTTYFSNTKQQEISHGIQSLI